MSQFEGLMSAFAGRIDMTSEGVCWRSGRAKTLRTQRVQPALRQRDTNLDQHHELTGKR
jgi:hypothetical protein